MRVIAALAIAIVVAAVLQWLGVDWVHYAQAAVDGLIGIVRDAIAAVRREAK
jgi:hypothetical protein